MHHPTDRITHTTAFVTLVVEHWLEREIAQWVHPMKDRSDDPSHHERTLYLWATPRSSEVEWQKSCAMVVYVSLWNKQTDQFINNTGVKVCYCLQYNTVPPPPGIILPLTNPMLNHIIKNILFVYIWKGCECICFPNNTHTHTHTHTLNKLLNNGFIHYKTMLCSERS